MIWDAKNCCFSAVTIISDDKVFCMTIEYEHMRYVWKDHGTRGRITITSC